MRSHVDDVAALDQEISVFTREDPVEVHLYHLFPLAQTTVHRASIRPGQRRQIPRRSDRCFEREPASGNRIRPRPIDLTGSSVHLMNKAKPACGGWLFAYIAAGAIITRHARLFIAKIYNSRTIIWPV